MSIQAGTQGPNRGQTRFQGLDVPALADAAQSIGQEGTVKDFPNWDPANVSPIVQEHRDQTKVVCVLARNVHSAAVLGKTAIRWTDGFYMRRFVPAGAGERFGGVVDELLPATGCRINDMCWVVIKGQTLASKVAAEAWAIGDPLKTAASGELSDTTVTFNQQLAGMALAVAAASTTEGLICVSPLISSVR